MSTHLLEDEVGVEVPLPSAAADSADKADFK
jgi:hypothetical protein